MNNTDLPVKDLPSVAPEYDLQTLLEAGCHFGHNSSDWHPSMAEWIYGAQEGIHIFDLEKTAQQLSIAYNYFYKLGKEGKDIIVVGTKRQAREHIQKYATEAGAHWVISRWMGGLLTNWQQVSKSIKKMIDIETGLKEGKYDMYTKYEQVQLEKDAGRLARFFDGLRGLKDMPAALFIIDPGKEDNAVKEAKMLGIPVIAMTDSNTDVREVDLVIPSNDDGRGAIELIVKEMCDAYARGKAEVAPKKAAKKAAEEKTEKTEKAEKPAEKPQAKVEKKEEAKKPAKAKKVTKKKEK